MLVKAILVGIIGVFAMLDSRLLGRLNFERPLIVSCLVGIALGDLQKGLMVGATLELMSLGIVSIGAAVPADMTLVSIIAAAFAILSNTNAQTALTIAIPIGILGQLLGIISRMFLATLTHSADKAVEEGKFVKAQNYHIVWGPIIYSLLYFVPVFLAIYFGTGVVNSFVKMIPEWLTNGLSLASKILPAYGFALLMSTMLSKKTTVFLMLGFFVTAYAKLSVTGVAIFAVILAVILYSLDKGNSNTPSAANQAPMDDLDDLEEL